MPEPSQWRERALALVDSLPFDRAALAGAGVALAAATAVGAIFLALQTGPTAPVQLPRARPSVPAVAVPEVLTVHAAGAVVRPGLYRLGRGSRVADLIEAASGAAADADLDRVNLAATVADGERVYIPRRGEAAAEGAASQGTAASPLDLNAATADQLDSLPGIGPATARAIVEWRRAHGRFRSVSELLDVRGIGPAKLDALRKLVRV